MCAGARDGRAPAEAPADHMEVAGALAVDVVALANEVRLGRAARDREELEQEAKRRCIEPERYQDDPNDYIWATWIDWNELPALPRE